MLLPIPIDDMDKITDGGETDTFSCAINIPNWIDNLKNNRFRSYYLMKAKFTELPEEIKQVINIFKSELTPRVIYKKVKQQDGTTKPTRIYKWVDSIQGYNFCYIPKTRYLHIMLSHQVIQGKDEEEIIEDIINLFKYYFGIPSKYIETLNRYIKLGRIDFKRDYPYRNQEELAIIKFLIRIATSSITRKNYNKVYGEEDNEEEDFDEYQYMVKYKSKSNKTVEFVVYDKGLEQKYKYTKNKTQEEDKDYYEGVIRFEVRIKNNKLNSEKKRKGIEKDIVNYKDSFTADDLFNQYAEEVFFKEKFYRIDIAKKLIKNSTESNSMKNKLIDLLVSINKIGYTETENTYKYKSSFKTHIKKIRDLGINPLTFNKEWEDIDGKVHKTTYTELSNFTLKHNCLYEDSIIIPSRLNKYLKSKTIDKL